MLGYRPEIEEIGISVVIPILTFRVTVVGAAAAWAAHFIRDVPGDPADLSELQKSFGETGHGRLRLCHVERP